VVQLRREQKRQHPSYQECLEDQKASERAQVYQVSDAFFAAKAIVPMMLMDHAPDGDVMSVSVNINAGETPRVRLNRSGFGCVCEALVSGVHGIGHVYVSACDEVWMAAANVIIYPAKSCLLPDRSHLVPRERVGRQWPSVPQA
jgi:hypothetical protein